MNDTPRVILASTSRYRAELLARLLADFTRVAPDVDETPLAGEAPAARALRLARAKASAVARAAGPGAIVIGSDQVAALGTALLRKPGSAECARAQLAASSGRTVHFHTALCVIATTSGTEHTHLDTTKVHFRALDAAEIARYVAREQPLDCAGSFKCEGLGIALFEALASDDPTALIGLPLVALARLLRESGIAVP